MDQSGPVRAKIVGMKGAYSSWNMSDYPVIAELRKAFTIKIRNTERKRSTKIWETLEEEKKLNIPSVTESER